MPTEEAKKDKNKLFESAFKFASLKHKNQKIKGSDVPYISHVSSVCFELLLMPNLNEYDVDFMLTVAALHDTIEDTDTTEIEILENFGLKVLSAVKALSKNYSLTKENQLIDSLERIIKEPNEVHLVKIADRIINLSTPPSIWTNEKIRKYYLSSIVLHEKLRESDLFLSEKLLNKINEYKEHWE
jgi:(p)ppGpp synthase/HD superfamily hydrolase